MKYLIMLTLGVTLFSCDILREKRDNAADKLVPTFDPDKPDTKFNKKRFQEFFDFAPTADVTQLYCFDDQIGIDSKFLFSFKCDSSTVQKIAYNLHLNKSDEPQNFSSQLWGHLSWWDSDKILTLNPYWNKSEQDTYKYLWYDRDKQTAYFIDFDL